MKESKEATPTRGARGAFVVAPMLLPALLLLLLATINPADARVAAGQFLFEEEDSAKVESLASDSPFGEIEEITPTRNARIVIFLLIGAVAVAGILAALAPVCCNCDRPPANDENRVQENDDNAKPTAIAYPKSLDTIRDDDDFFDDEYQPSQ